MSNRNKSKDRQGLHPIIRDARQTAKELAARHADDWERNPKRCAEMASRAFRVMLPKGEPGRPADPNVLKAVEMIRAQEAAGKRRDWQAVYLACIPNYNRMSDAKRRSERSRLRNNVRATFRRRRRAKGGSIATTNDHRNLSRGSISPPAKPDTLSPER